MTNAPLSTLQLKTQLHVNGYSLTKPRLAVFRALQKGPMSNVELGDALRGVDRSSVYRTVQLFENINIAKRIWHGSTSKIELSEIYAPHHHHAHCTNCGKHIPVVSSKLENELQAIASRLDFNLHDHHLGLIGICASCRKADTT